MEENIEYNSLGDVGKDFVDISKRDNSKCLHKDMIVGNVRLRAIRCLLGDKERLWIGYYPETGKIFEVINIKKLWHVIN